MPTVAADALPVDDRRRRSRKKFVVLAGWLGAKPSSLRRYELLYESMGWTVLVRVAPPRAVVAASTTPPTTPTRENEKSNETRTTKTTAKKGSFRRPEMETIAEELYHDVLVSFTATTPHQRPNDDDDDHDDGSLVFHAFSNGGCFLWEAFRRVLLSRDRRLFSSSSSPGGRAVDSGPRHAFPKLVGLVFDSGPCRYESAAQLKRAMREGAVVGGDGVGAATTKKTTKTDSTTVPNDEGRDSKARTREDDETEEEAVVGGSSPRIAKRASQFWYAMRNDDCCYYHHHVDARRSRGLVPSNGGEAVARWRVQIPELYVYSRDDPLAPVEPLRDLVSYRSRGRKDSLFSAPYHQRSVRSLEFSASQHCAHLKEHPETYATVLSNFLDDAIAVSSVVERARDADADDEDVRTTVAVASPRSRL